MDIEDITSIEINKEFVKELTNYEFDSDADFQGKYTLLRKKYKISLSKPNLRKIYNELVVNDEIQRNPSFLKYSIKKKIKSISGVSVITLLTSPHPEYTNSNGEKVNQSFSCGHSCAYCPNEPEIRLTLSIFDIDRGTSMLFVKTNDDISIIRTISYIIKDNIEYNVQDSSNFTSNTFTMIVSSIYTFEIGDILTGVKISQPRSYLSTEPAVLRANRNKFNPVLQIYDRADALLNCGHEVDKIEVLVLGGTWDHYPIEYQKEFIRDIYYAVNTLTHRGVPKCSLEEEININETSNRRLIGLTLETRPDCINLKQIKKMREFNVTRLQIGVQHIDNDVLEHIERGCTNEDTIHGNYLWKHNGGKIDMHLMPDLPGSTKEKDIDMFKKIFGVNAILEVSKNHFRYDLKHPELQTDQLKIYPCSTVDWTKIKEWYDNGTYKPYSENKNDLIDVINYIHEHVFPWIRINRIIRDIPNINIIGGNKITNLRQQISDKNCKCIRTREVKGDIKDIDNAELVIREYNGVNSKEFFISYESKDKKILYGFLRLRINNDNYNLIYPELHNCSFIRELHVYGNLIKHCNKNEQSVQHRGFGKTLLKKAESISYNHGVKKIAIISGVGVREYYKNRGYTLIQNYMIKELNYNKILNINDYIVELLLYISIIIMVVSIIYDINY